MHWLKLAKTARGPANAAKNLPRPNKHLIRAAYACCLAATYLFFSIAAGASEVDQSELEFVGKRYDYRFAVNINASIDAVYAVVTDYDNMKRINDDVVQSAVLERYDDDSLKRLMWLNHCILFFCFDLYFVEHVEQIDEMTIQTRVIASESNFKSGNSTWRVEPLDEQRTRVSVEATQEPDFWIPPVIGPLILKRAFMKEVKETATKIEQEALHVELQ